MGMLCCYLGAVLLMLAGAAYPLVQPTTIPGTFYVTTQPYPALQEIVNKPAPAMPVYGIYTGSGELLMNQARFKAVGWKSLRVEGFNDIAMLLSAQNGYEAMPVLISARRDECSSDQDFLDRYAALIKTSALAYGPNGTFFTQNPSKPKLPVNYWELWNEPNFEFMWNAGTNTQREALYAKAIVMAYDTLKKYSPTATAVGFGTGGSGAGDKGFIQHVHQQNAEVKNSYDILSTHPYVDPCPPEADKQEAWGIYSIARSLADIRATLTANGKSNCPIWYTECGWGISQAEGGNFPVSGSTISQRLQAAYVCRVYALALRLGVERMHIMYAIDVENYNAGFFGGSTWRESAFAVQCMIRILSNPKIRAAISDGTNGYYAYYLKPDANAAADDSVIMAWNVAGPATVNIPVRAGQAYCIIDMLNDTTRITATSSQQSVAIGACPVYIVKAVTSPIRPAAVVSVPPVGPVAVQPNPCRGSAAISFDLARSSRVEVTVLDLSGQTVRQLVSGRLSAGKHTAPWDGTTARGARVLGGTYAIKVVTESCTQMQQILWMP